MVCVGELKGLWIPAPRLKPSGTGCAGKTVGEKGRASSPCMNHGHRLVSIYVQKREKASIQTAQPHSIPTRLTVIQRLEKRGITEADCVLTLLLDLVTINSCDECVTVRMGEGKQPYSERMEGTMKGQKLWKPVFGCLVASAMVAGLLLGPAVAAKKIRIAIGFNGSMKDKGWYEGAYAAANRLKKDPAVVEVSYQENIKNSDIEGAMRRWAVEGYNLIYGHSYEFGEPARKLAKQFPNTIFAIPFFFKTKGFPNVVNYGAQSLDVVFAAGSLAALMSKTKKIGVIGGHPVPHKIAEHNGYKVGARHVVPNIKISSVFINDWFDAAKAKEAAIAMIEQGVDVVYTTASPVGIGAIYGAQDKGVYAIGTYMDWRSLAPDNVISSVVYVWDVPMQQIVKDMKRGKVGQQYLLGVAAGAAKLAPFNKKVPPEVAEKVRAVEKGIKAGKIKVPYLPKKEID